MALDVGESKVVEGTGLLEEELLRRKWAEEALRESEERYRTLFEQSRDAVYITSRDGRIVDVNRSMLELFGYTREEFMGLLAQDTYVDPTERRRYQREIEEKGAVRDYEVRLRKKDGTEMDCLVTGTVRRAKDGSVAGYQGIIRDITERKRAEERLTRLSNAVEMSTDSIVISDIEAKIIDVNEATLKMYGTDDRRDLIGKNSFDLIAPEDREKAFARTQEVLKTGYIRSEEYYVIAKDGSRIPMEMSVAVMRDVDGKAIGFVGISRDITERKRAEEALRESEEKYRSIFEKVATSIVLSDKDGQIVDLNPYHITHIGKGRTTKKDYLGKNIVTHPSIVNAGLSETYARLLKGEPFDLKDVYFPTITGGTDGYFNVKGVPLFEEGKVIGAITIHEDITERKRAEEEVQRHLERLEALREIDRAISSTLDLSEVLDIILEQLERVIPYSSAAIFLLSDDIAKITAGRGFPDMKQVMGVSFPAEEDPLTRQLLQEGRPLVLADAQADKRFRARGGVEYVRSWIGVPLTVREEAIGFLTIDHREPGVYDEERGETALAFASQAAIAIENARAYEELKALNLQTIEALASAVEAKDPYTAGHSTGVTEYAVAIAERMGRPAEEIETLRVASLLHDIGKIGIPGSVLNKPARLTSAEFVMIQAHPVISAEIIEKVKPLASAVPIIRHHHERWDGTGYPDGLKGEDIPLMARILAVADGFEAMTSERPYRRALTEEEALAELEKGAGSQWDPEVVEVFVKRYEEGALKHQADGQ